MIYHVSERENLEVLMPKISTHGKAFVYAVKQRYLALLFGAKKDDFDFFMDFADGKAIVYECYKDAFREIYENKKCSVYYVAEDLFLENQTNWEPELVSENPVFVKKEEKITNLYEELKEEMVKGNILLYTYQDSMEYRRKIANHVVDRIVRFGMLENGISNRIKERFPKLIKELENVVSGEYLS